MKLSPLHVVSLKTSFMPALLGPSHLMGGVGEGLTRVASFLDKIQTWLHPSCPARWNSMWPNSYLSAVCPVFEKLPLGGTYQLFREISIDVYKELKSLCERLFLNHSAVTGHRWISRTFNMLLDCESPRGGFSVQPLPTLTCSLNLCFQSTRTRVMWTPAFLLLRITNVLTPLPAIPHPGI